MGALLDDQDPAGVYSPFAGPLTVIEDIGVIFLRWALRCVLILALLILPLNIVLIEVISFVSPPAWAQNLQAEHGEAVGYFLWQYVLLILPIVLGGIVQALLLWSFTPRVGKGTTRFILVLSTLVVPVVIVVMGTRLELLLSPRAGIPLLVSLVVYGLIMPPPPKWQPVSLPMGTRPD